MNGFRNVAGLLWFSMRKGSGFAALGTGTSIRWSAPDDTEQQAGYQKIKKGQSIMNSQEISIQAWSTEIFHQSENVKSSPNFGVEPFSVTMRSVFCNLLKKKMVGATGFEPATSSSQSWRSSQAELRSEPEQVAIWGQNRSLAKVFFTFSFSFFIRLEIWLF